MSNSNEQPLPSNMLMGATLMIPNTEAIGKLESAEAGVNLTVKYKTQEEWVEGESIRCYFLGLKEIPNEEGETVICGGFMGKDGVFLAAQMVLIDAVRSLAKGTAIEIIYRGKKKNVSSDGKTNLFDVKLLNVVL